MAKRNLQRRPLFRHDLRAVRNRAPRIERVGMLVWRQEFFHLAGIGQLHIRRDVRNEKAVLANHLRQQHSRIFADAIPHQMIVERLLRVARPAHDPAHVARRKRIRVL